MLNTPVHVGLIGCGNISTAYLTISKQFEAFTIVACADIDEERARVVAIREGIRARTVAELIADPAIPVILNLTIPQAHADVTHQALAAGKSVYSEKPLGANAREALQVVEAIGTEQYVGCAPDTFLGTGLQTSRAIIDRGEIGRPFAGIVTMASHGPDHWHPNPAFFYQYGGGPLYDMGPYYLTALVFLLGPIRRVTGFTTAALNEREALSGPLAGQRFPVEIPTTYAGALEFVSGAIVNLYFSFDTWAHHLPQFEIYGTDATLVVPDPNTFGGPVYVGRRTNPGDSPHWTEVPLLAGFHENSRGIGLAEMLHAIQAGRSHRAHSQMAYHILEACAALETSAASGSIVTLTSTCTQPEPLPIIENVPKPEMLLY